MRFSAQMLTDEYRYKILKLVEAKPEISQRELAENLGISLGKANFCLKALIEVGLLKATNFRNSKKKISLHVFIDPSRCRREVKYHATLLKVKNERV